MTRGPTGGASGGEMGGHEAGDRPLAREPPRGRAPGRQRIVAWCVAAGVIGAGLAIAGQPVDAQTEDPDAQIGNQCLASGTTGQRDDILATRVLHLSDPPTSLRVERNGPPVRRGLRFETDLDPAFLQQPEAANFLVTGTLFSTDHGDLEGYVEVNASADGQDEIAATLCIDPTPAGLGALPVGVYRARLKFDDARVPEVVTEIEVLVGETSSRTRYWLMVALVSIALGAGTFALVELTGQRGVPGPGDEALRRTRRVRAGLSAGVALAVLVVGVAFTQDRDFATWSLSMAGLWTFLGFAYGALLLALGAVVSGAKQVRDLTDLVAGQPTAPTPLPPPAPITADGRRALPPSPPTPEWVPVPEQAPTDADGAPDIPSAPSPGRATVPPAATTPTAGGPGRSEVPPSPGWAARGRRGQAPRPRSPRVRRVPVLVGAAIGGIILVVLVASVAERDGGDDATTAPTNTTQTTGGGTTTTVEETRPTDPFDGLAGGSTDGATAVAQLRSAGFVVFDYDVCSDSVQSSGVLRQVRLTRTGEEVVGLDGPTDVAATLEAPAELDVLVTTGSPCD